MRLKKQKAHTSTKIYYALIVLGLLFLITYTINSPVIQFIKTKSYKALDTPTYVPKVYNHVNIIKEGLNIIYEDSILSIHINENLGVPFISYVYKDSLVGRQKTDNFYLHFFLKNTDQLKKQRKSISLNSSFNALKPLELEIDNKKYFVFKKILDDELFDFDNIKHLNTGRINRHRTSKSLKILNLQIKKPLPYKLGGGFNKFSFEISEKSLQKIQDKRESAINNNILITHDDDLVNSKISFQKSKREKAKVRLKGDWVDHINHPTKWSFRIIMEEENTISGMRKFSIQHPKSRNYIWEWMFNKTIKEENLIGLRYDFVDVDMLVAKNKQITQKIPFGIMAIEESFDKILLENNKRKEGIILAFDESLIWKDREKQFHLGLEENTRSSKLHDILNATIKIFNKNKILSDPQLSKQLKTAIELLDGLRKGKFKISEVFDIDKLTSFVAISNLFGGKHGLISHNIRVYFNPITNKLEPISFDSNSGQKLTHILHYPFSKGDDYYMEKLLEKMEFYCQSKYLNDLIERNHEELTELYLNLNNEFDINLDLSILEYNSNFIKKKINPSNSIISSFINYKKDTILLEVFNVSNFPIVIKNLIHKDGKKLNAATLNSIISPDTSKLIPIALKPSFNNAFVSKKNKVGGFRYPKDISKLNLSYKTIGISYIRSESISSLSKNPNNTDLNKEQLQFFTENFKNFDFITEEAHSIIKFKKGNHKVDKDIIIPKNYRVLIEKGTQLDLQNNASILSFSPINCMGTQEQPILFYSSNNTGGGIFVSGPLEKSILEYCNFSNLSNPNSKLWNLSGAVNFHETEVEIKNSIFEKSRCEDGLNIIRSTFSISETEFNNTLSDAFDGDFVEGTLKNCSFNNTGNDGIDVSGSTINLEEIVFNNPSDKAISAGESSLVTGNNISVTGGEIGIVSKDLSKIIISNVTISNTRLGLSAFQKKSEYGAGFLQVSNAKLINNELNFLIEEGSKLYLDNKLMKTVTNSVIDQMYGKEYGKSSK